GSGFLAGAAAVWAAATAWVLPAISMSLVSPANAGRNIATSVSEARPPARLSSVLRRDLACAKSSATASGGFGGPPAFCAGFFSSFAPPFLAAGTAASPFEHWGLTSSVCTPAVAGGKQAVPDASISPNTLAAKSV